MKISDLKGLSAEQRTRLGAAITEAKADIREMLDSGKGKGRGISPTQKAWLDYRAKLLEHELAAIVVGSGGESLAELMEENERLRGRCETLEIELDRATTRLSEMEQSGWQLPT
jgi:hypothetical protein